jgi:hypothetical protein
MGPTSACNKGSPIRNSVIQKHDIYIKKDIKITYATKKLDRWRLTHLPSLLTRRHWYCWISGEVDPRVWVVLNSWDLP